MRTWTAFLLGLIGAYHPASAQTSTWTGAGLNDLWSNGGNWSGGVPVNGDSVVFGVDGSGVSLLDYTLSLAAFRFAPAILPEHNFHLGTGASLTLTGFGIDNASRIPGFGQPQSPPGVIRQQLFMDAGSMLTFRNSATIGGTNPVFSLPVDLNAFGASTAGGLGSRISFEDNSTASGGPASTFTGLRVYGGAVAGAAGAELTFRDNSSLGFTASLSIQPGAALGAEGGSVIFEENATAASGSNSNLTGSGLGGRLIFRQSARATGGFSVSNFGAGTLDAGNEAVTEVLDDAVFDAFAQNFAGSQSGMQGGRLEFHQNAVFGGSGGFIINRGSGFDGGEGARTIFHDDASIAMSGATISNRTETEGPNHRSIGGITEFRGNSRAGAATIFNSGTSSSAPGTIGAQTLFRENSSAESATIVAAGGIGEPGAFGSSIEFSGASSAATATLTAGSGSSGALGGSIVLKEAATGASANVIVEFGGIFDMSALSTPETTVGSLAGAGAFLLGEKSLTVGGNGQSTEVAGVIADGGRAGGIGATLTKVGTGTLTLAGVNTYTGSTTVSEGDLVVNGSIGGPSVSVTSGAVLGGSGTINAPVTVNGGRIAPGPVGTFGTLTLGPLSLNTATNLDFQLRDGAHDRVVVNGPLLLDGTMNVAAPTGLTLGIYRLFDYSGALTDNGLLLGTIPAGTSATDFTILTNTPGQIDLVLGGDTDLLFWDGPQTTPNNVINGGTGTWNNAASNWTNSAGSVQRGWNARTAVFAGAAGLVTLGENITSNGLQFVTTNYTIAAGAGSTVTLVGAAPVRVDGAIATMGASFVGDGQLVKTGPGRLTLTAANNHTGGTVIVDGVLAVTSPTGLGLGTGPVTVRESRTSYLQFANAASAGNLAVTNEGSATDVPGVILFSENATAWNATLTNGGNTAVLGLGAFTLFQNTSRAGTSTIQNLGAAFEGTGGEVHFSQSTNAEAATITNGAGLDAGLSGGQTQFSGTARAGSAAILNRGGTVSGASGGLTIFQGSATADTATITLEGGSNGGLGGVLRFVEAATGASARVVFISGGAANGLFDISGTSAAMLGIASVEGSGLIELGNRRLEIGGTNASTEFSGRISGFGGGIRKIGVGVLTLSGTNTYSGDTIVHQGEIVTRSNIGTGSAAILAGATLRFVDNARAPGNLIIVNPSASSTNGAQLIFANSAFANSAVIQQFGSTQANVNSVAATTLWDPLESTCRHASLSIL